MTTQTQQQKDIINNFNYILSKPINKSTKECSKRSETDTQKIQSIYKYHITLTKQQNDIINLINSDIRAEIIDKFELWHQSQAHTDAERSEAEEHIKEPSNIYIMLYPKYIHDFCKYFRDNSPKPELKDIYIFIVCSYLGNDAIPYTKIYLYKLNMRNETFKELSPMLYNYETSIRLYNNIKLQDLIALNYCDMFNIKLQLLKIHKEPKHNNLNIIHIDNNKYNNDPNNIKLLSYNDPPIKSNHKKYEIIYYKGSTNDLHEITTINNQQLKQPIYITNDKQLYKHNKQGYKQLHKYNSNIGTYYKTKDKNNKIIFINDDILKSLIK